MKSTSVELHERFDEKTNISDLLESKFPHKADELLFKVQRAEGEWQDITARQFHEQVVAVAKGLIAAGISPGDRVGIMSRTRYEWAVIDFGIAYAGGVSVPVYETSSPSQIAWILGDSGARAVIVESRQHSAAVRRATQHADLAVENVWQIDAAESDQASLSALKKLGALVDDSQLEASRTSRRLDDAATIIYTSGTTGKPKGCLLSHANFVKLCASARQAIPEVASSQNSTLLFLPLAHVFARYIHVLSIDAGVVVGHCPDLKHLTGDIKSFSPTFLLVVPRVFEKIYNGARATAHDASRLKGRIFDAAERIGVKWSETVMSGRKPSPLLAGQYAVVNRLVFAQLREAMGGRVSYAVSGGGPLGTYLGHFFHAVGIKILEGYGLTETTAPLTVGTVKDFQIGTVGPPLPGTEIRIADDGEVLCRGVGVIDHYHENSEADADSFTEDGWFRTGDLGELTDQGMLKITGRKKEILVTAGGKNVIPGLVEDEIRKSPLVSQCVVIGDQRPFIAALITLDEETLPKQLSELGLDSTMSPEAAAESEEVQHAVQELIDRANDNVSKAESVRAFRIIPQDFTEQSGHLTPSLKIRRPQIMKDYAEIIDSIYAQKKPTS
ncbi:AMP-dependent synthetase/ligase [Kocuria sp. HSID16901]|uniref:AMP-dependent synthetase/ligase n=1 Tax=Kocuria sp. HSID16901 TaxID=2419505 RepID=UPI000660DB35|nr:AMP-dependent synthetase/ligase [Kocuria sp. HSID16901]RUQ20468.1 long-chain fatty acid--CoA ligase [Kocuria sp. HSID16901]